MIRTKLMSHQRAVVDFCKNKEDFKILEETGITTVKHKNYIGIFSDYGTGKTLCYLTLVEELNFKNILVVSTKTAIQVTWPAEIKKHTNFNYVFLLGSEQEKIRTLALYLKRSKQVYGENNRTIFLINYDGLKNNRVGQAIVDANFDSICIDESTKIKSPKTLRTQFLWAIGAKIKHRVIMTGFPATEGLHELYSQIKFLDNGAALGNSWWGFCNKLFTKIQNKLVPRKNSNKWVTGRIKDFCIRVTNTILKDMPAENYIKILVPKTDKQIHILNQLDNYFSVEFDTQYVLALIAKSLQVCDGFMYGDDGKVESIETNKDEILIDKLEEIDTRQHKVVIWCSFTYTLKKVYSLLKKLSESGYPHFSPLLIKGDTVDIQKIVSTFKYSNKHNILVASLKKANESITLTEKNHICKYAIYYSNSWSRDIRGNSEARMGKVRAAMSGYKKDDYTITYIDLVTENSREVSVYNALRNKKRLVDVLKEEFRQKLQPKSIT